MSSSYITVNTDAYVSRVAKPSFLIACLMMAVGFNSAVGTNLDIRPYYLVPAVSWIDVIMFINFLMLVNWKSGSMRILATKPEKTLAYGICAFSCLLILSTCINSFRYPSNLSDIGPALKIIYFIVLIHVVRKYTEKFGIFYFIIGFCLGASAFLFQSFSQAQVASSGLPILWNPNVTGGILALGIFFSALLISFEKKIFLPLFFATAFMGASSMTWSKGTWIMCAMGFCLIILLLFDYFRMHKKLIYASLAIVTLFVFFIVYVIAVNLEVIMAVFEHKMSSTANIDSVGHRFKLMVASVYGGFQNPFGVGYRNFYQVQNYATNVGLPAMDASWNAHNVFFQTLAVAGVPAFLVLMGIFSFPFLMLKRIFRRVHGVKVRDYLFILIALGIWSIFGLVQLQLITQPMFWFFCGLVIGLYSVSNGLPDGARVMQS